MTGETKRVVAYASAVVVALVAIAAVTIDNAREPVWLESPPQWGAGPILVAYEPGLAYHAADIKAAIAQVNREADCTVFSLTTPANAKAILKWVDTEACGLGDRSKPLDRMKHVEGMWDCRNGTVEVQFAELADPGLRFPIIVHALGHVAGLAHDTSGDSVMLDPPPEMVAGRLAPGFTRKDGKALKGKFCP